MFVREVLFVTVDFDTWLELLEMMVVELLYLERGMESVLWKLTCTYISRRAVCYFDLSWQDMK